MRLIFGSRRRIEQLIAERDQCCANALEFRNALFAKHKQLVDMTDSCEAWKKVAAKYLAALQEAKRGGLQG